MSDFGKAPEEHDKEEKEALRWASESLKESNPLLEKVSWQKLDQMASDVICAWIIARSKLHAGKPELENVLTKVPGRVPVMEPFIRQSLTDVVKHMELPFDQAVGSWNAMDVVRMISASWAYSNLAEQHARESVPS